MSLDVLKLYRGEDVVQQEPTDVDPYGRGEEGELTELPEISARERDRVFMETRLDPVNLKMTAEPDLEVPMVLDDPEEMAVREGIHERIQAEIYYKDKEREAQAEEMLDRPLKWNEAKDLIWEDGDIFSEGVRQEKRMRSEIS